MPSAFILLAPRFEDIEAVTVLDILHRAGVHVTTVALDVSAKDLMVKSDHDLTVKADVSITEVEGKVEDAIIFPGGLEATEFINKSEGAKKMCEAHMKAGKLVCAICAAPAVGLGSWGVLSGHEVVHYPCLPKSSEEYLGPNTKYDKDLSHRVLADGNVITSRGPGTSAEFALKIVERLVGPEMKKTLISGMLWQL